MKIHHQVPLNFNYSTSEIIGKGFTSQVYKGVSKITGFPLAVKVIDRNAMKEQDRKLINTQIASMRKLRGKSPYILNLIEVNEVGSTIFIVTEQCDCDLGKILQETRLRQKQVIAIMQQVIRGFLCIASNGIIHRDLKPANIFMKNNHIKIGDFGFAIGIEDIKTCHNVGSPHYMSPQVMQNTQYSFQSDIWSLGIIFYQMLFGCVPWDAENEQQLFQKITTISITQVLKDKFLSQNCYSFIQKALNPNPNNRMTLKQLQSFALRTLTPVTTLFNNRSPLPHPQVRSFKQQPSTHRQTNSILLNPQNITPQFIKDSNKPQSFNLLRHQLYLCEYFIELYLSICPLTVGKTTNIKRIFQKFIQRKLLHLLSCSTQNPFNIASIQSFRSCSDYLKFQKQLITLTQKYKYQFKIQSLPQFIPQANYRQMKQQIMNNITSLFIDSNKTNGIKISVDRKFLLDSLVSAYELIRVIAIDDAILLYKSGNIVQLLKNIRSKNK